jgi:hypothetical protein
LPDLSKTHYRWLRPYTLKCALMKGKHIEYKDELIMDEILPYHQEKRTALKFDNKKWFKMSQLCEAGSETIYFRYWPNSDMVVTLFSWYSADKL